MEKVKRTIGFIGAGVTGTALACQLWQQGYKIVAVNSRSTRSSARLASMISECTVYNSPQQVADAAQIVFITTPDDLIADIASNLGWHPEQTVIHCSGVHSIDILETAHKYGANICCLHPLQTFASIEEAVKGIAGSTFALEGDEPALELARELAAALNGNIIILKAGDKVLYHAAAVTLSNYLVTLMKTATDFWQSLGIPQNQAIQALLPLLKGTVNNIERVGIPQCLTGPISRGDVETIRKHVTALEKIHPDSVDIYKVLGLRTLSIALAKGHVSLDTAEEMRDVLEAREKRETGRPDYYYEDPGAGTPAIYIPSFADNK